MPLRSILIQLILFSTGTYSLFAQIRYEKTPDNRIKVFINSDNAAIAFDLSRDFIRASHSKQIAKSKFGGFKLKEKHSTTFSHPIIDTIYSNQDSLLLQGRVFHGHQQCPFRVCICKTVAGYLNLTAEALKTSINGITLTLGSTANEHFFGGGEQYSFMDLKGHVVPMLVEEQGIGRGDKGISALTKLLGISGTKASTYAPIPWLMSSLGSGILLKGYNYTSVDLTKPEEMTFSVWHHSLSILVMQDNNPMNLLQNLSAITGRMPILPTWAHGTILGLQGGKDKVNKIVDEAIAAGNPVTAVWIQDWVGKRDTKFGQRLWWNWEPDTTSYGDMKAFCAQMNKKGIKVLAYINPFLAPEGNMGKIAAQKGYVVKRADGSNYLVPAGGFDAYMLDLSNPGTIAWMKENMKQNLLDNGFSGWMADFAEWLPFDAKLWDGKTGQEEHNLYPVQWAKLNRTVADLGNEIVFFSRSGYLGSAGYSNLFWAGDQMHTYGKNDGLPSAINAIISSGMSGISLNHSDIGGYTTVSAPFFHFVRDTDLFYRWTEVNVFMPFFRTHEGLIPKSNVQFYTDRKTQSFFAKMGGIHLALKPYFQFLEKEAAEHGYPLIRHPYLTYPTDTNTIALQYQFMLGSDLMVIPVISKNATAVSGYLPEGQWENIWSGKTYGQGFHTFDALYGKPAVFYKVGGTWYRQLKQMLAAEVNKP